MTDPTPLISDSLGAGIIAAIVAAGGGLVAFLRWAVNTWLTERKIERTEMLTDRKEERDERRLDRSVLGDMRVDVQALVMQSQRRDERRRAETAQPPNRPRGVPRDEFAGEETTDIVEIQRELRANSAPRKPTPVAGIKRLNTKAEDR